MSIQCVDCGCRDGSLHELFCTKETCPFCHGQLVSCSCIRTELELSDEEKVALEEYVDDTEEPLKGVIERWTQKLTRKGRIPFGKLTSL